MLRRAQTYLTSAGEVKVERWLYKDRTVEEARTRSPMEIRLGIVDGLWTEKAAKGALRVVTQMTPQKAEELFERVGNFGGLSGVDSTSLRLRASRKEPLRPQHE